MQSFILCGCSLKKSNKLLSFRLLQIAKIPFWTFLKTPSDGLGDYFLAHSYQGKTIHVTKRECDAFLAKTLHSPQT